MDSKLNIKKGDYIVFFVAVLVSGIALWFFAGAEKGETVIVTANGKKNIYSLSQEQNIEIQGKNGQYNLIVIQSGKVCMKSADCSDQVCVKHREISKNGELIICLPNEVFIQIEGGEEKEVDN